jgi:hypothetical protein
MGSSLGAAPSHHAHRQASDALSDVGASAAGGGLLSPDKGSGTAGGAELLAPNALSSLTGIALPGAFGEVKRARRTLKRTVRTTRALHPLVQACCNSLHHFNYNYR